LSHGDEQCSGSVGACKSQRASLMQLKSFSQLKTSSLSSAKELSQQLAAYQKYTDKLVAQAKSGQAPPLDDATKDAINTIKAFIDGMYAHMLQYHNDDYILATECVGQVDNCTAHHLPAGVRDDINTAKNQALQAEQTHSGCRGNLSTICSQQTVACNEYDLYRTSNPAALLPGCVDPNLNQAHIQTQDEAMLSDMESCLEQTKAWLDPLYAKYDACERNGCDEKKGECLDNQKEFEYKICEWNTIVKSRCESFRSCWTDVFNTCQEHCNMVQQRAYARATDNETAERIDCLLDAMLIEGTPEDPNAAAKQEQLDLCINKEYDTSFWSDLADHCPEGLLSGTPDYPEAGICDQPEHVPCSVAFVAHYYTNKGVESPDECQEDCPVS